MHSYFISTQLQRALASTTEIPSDEPTSVLVSACRWSSEPFHLSEATWAAGKVSYCVTYTIWTQCTWFVQDWNFTRPVWVLFHGQAQEVKVKRNSVRVSKVQKEMLDWVSYKTATNSVDWCLDFILVFADILLLQYLIAKNVPIFGKY